MESSRVIDITTGTIVRIIVALFVVFLLWQVVDVLEALAVAIVIASALEPAVLWFKRRGLPRTFAVLLLYIIILSAVFFAAYSVFPSLLGELQRFFVDLPRYITSATQELETRFPFFSLDRTATRFIEFISTRAGAIFEGTAAGFFNGASAFFGGVFSLIIVIVVSFYLSAQEQGVVRFLRLVAPEEHEAYLVNLWMRSQKKIERWLQGQIILGLIVGSIVFIGLTIMRVEYAFSLAVLSAIFELIPFFGPIMAALPGIVVATLQKPFLGLIVFFFYLFVQQVENHLIYPVVVRKMIGISPIVVILALIMGANLGGIFGIILAIPVAVILTEYLNDRASKKGLRSES